MSKKAVPAKKDTSPKVYQREKIDFELKINELPWTEKQKALIEAGTHKDNRVIFLEGPAGSSKTTSAMRIGLQLLKEKKVSDIVCVRAAVESSDAKLGYLPGAIEDKYGPYMGPFEDKLEELVGPQDLKRLKADNRIICQPINFVRGASWTARFVIIDEAQNLTYKELKTLLTRIGKFTKMVICADSGQSDLPENKQGGFDRCLHMFDTSEATDMGILSLAFTEEDIVRSELCRFIVKTFDAEQERIKSARNIPQTVSH